MNNLSWFIYLTQVTDGLSSFLWFMFFFGLIGVIIWLVVAGVCAIDDDEKTQLKFWRTAIASKVWLFGVVAIIAVALPSRQTMLLIAGSEMGERAMKSNAVQDVVNPGVDLLKTWIKEETDKLKSAKK